jgi:hypothetical protein
MTASSDDLSLGDKSALPESRRDGVRGDGAVEGAVPAPTGVPKLGPDDEGWWAEHGISKQVREARGYRRYDPDRLDAVREAFSSCAPNQQEWALNQASKGPGLLMPKHGLIVSDGLPSFPELATPPVPPQLRPDEPLRKRSRRHHHPASEAWTMREHILRHKDHLGLTSKQRAELTDEQARELVHGNNAEEPHTHEEYAKYLLTITATEPLTHNHDEHYKTEWRRRRHVKKHHGGVDIHGTHTHEDLLIDVDDPKRSPGKRIDINPLARGALVGPYSRSTQLVFICIEGSIKVDAITTAILKDGLPASAIAVPSVGQWDADELPVLQHLLAGKLAVIVADADGRDNEQVMTHALLLRSELERMKVRACVALPPYDVYCNNNSIKGVDDFLGSKHKGNLLDLDVVGHELPPAFHGWAEKHPQDTLYRGKRIRRDAAESDIEALKGIILLAGPHGRTTASLHKVARFMGLTDDRVERAVKRLIAAKVIEVDKPLATARWQYRTDTYKDPNLDWTERPTIAIADRALWACETQTVTLRKWLETSKLDEMQSAVWEGRDPVTLNELADAVGRLTDENDVEVTVRITKKEPRPGVASEPEFTRELDAWRAES